MSREIQSIPVTFANTGIIIKSAADEIPQTAYRVLSNAQTDKENTVSVRSGFTRLNDGLPTAPYSSYFLKDYNNRQWRYAITGGKLYVAPVTDPNDASVWPLALGNQFAAVYGGSGLSTAADPRPLYATFSLQGSQMRPFIFLADGTTFIKHSGGLDSARRVGIPAPTSPITSIATAAQSAILVEEFEDYTEWAGGDSGLTTPTTTPAIWQYGSSTLDARYYYAKYTFTYADGSESFASSAGSPGYIRAGEAARIYWKSPKSSFVKSALMHAYTVGTYFDESQGDFIPDGARLTGIRMLAGGHIHRIRPIWTLPDGTVQEGGHHGGGEGTQYDFVLDFDEHITSIKYGYGIDSYIDPPYLFGDNVKVDWLQFVTNKRTSQVYGGEDGTSPQEGEISIPADTATESYSLVGFHGYYGDGNSAYQADILNLGFVWRKDTFESSDTALAGATGWNLYLGTNESTLQLVNSTPMSLASHYAEPSTGPTYITLNPPTPNLGDLSNDASGETGNALKIGLTGDGVSGRALKIFTNAAGYPIVKDFGTTDPEEAFKISIKFADAEAKANVSSIRLKFILSDLPGDIGDKYRYYATATLTNFSAHTPGSWTQETIYKSSFVLNNYGGQTWSNLGWDTVTAVEVETITIDPATGGKTCDVSYDNLYYVPVGQLTGTNYQWTYTFYNSLTDTESDYATPFVNNLGPLNDQAVLLSFPATPYTNPPMANPDKIRIYRFGGTVEQFQLVDTVDYVAGFAFTYLDNIPDTDLGDELEDDNQLPPNAVDGVEVYDNRLWVWGGSFTVGGTTVLEPKNRLRFSKGTRVEHFPSDNYIQVGSGNEQIQRVLEHDGELFVFTLTKVYRIVGDSPDTYKAISTPVNKGLTNKHCACRGDRALYMRAYDGIYEFPSGRKISEPMNQVFFQQTVNGIEPIAPGREIEEAMGFWNSKLYFCYCASTDQSLENDRTLIFDTLYDRWSWYIYGAQNLYTEPENNILVGANITQWYNQVGGTPVDTRNTGAWLMQMDNGFADVFSGATYGIPCTVETREYDLGFPDQEKQFIDLIVDADTQGYPVEVQASFDGGDFQPIGIVTTAERQRLVLPIVLGEENSMQGVRMSLRLTFTSDPNATDNTRIYKIVHRVLLEPPRHKTHVTDWSYWGHQGPKFFTEFWVEMDTFGNALNGIEVQVDGAVVKTLTTDITTDGRQKKYYGLGVDVRGILARLKFKTTDDNEIKIYDFGFTTIPEPPLVNTYQQPYTDNGWPYRKLWKHIEFEMDTENDLIDFDFWVDGEIVESYSLIADGRSHIVQSIAKETFGKIGRITVNMPQLDSDGNAQGVRIYDPPKFATENRHPDVTVSDSFSQTLVNERVKVLKKIWHVIDNPNATVTLQIYIDNTLKGTFTIGTTLSVNPQLSARRMDIPTGYKGRIFRFVFTSSQAFEIDWPKTHIVLRDLNLEDPHRRPRLEPPRTY